MFEKLKKTAVVVILTLLIWTGSYLALEQDITRTATLDILPSRPLLVTFVNAERPVEIELTLKGPAAKITQLQKMLQSDDPEEREKFDFYFDAEEEGKTEPGRYVINIPELLGKTAKLRNYSLTIPAESCKPETVEIEVEKLVKKTLTIQCLDNDSGVELISEKITPSPTVEMYVKASWPDDDLKAKVLLTPEQIVQARQSYVTIQPFIVLSAGEQPRYADYHNITLPSTSLPVWSFQPSIGYIRSKNTREKYDIELLNEKELTSTTSFRATDEAWKEYKEKTTPHLLISISKPESGEIAAVPVIYNFPQQYVRKGEIELADPDSAPKAKFKLIPISQSAPPIQ